MNKTNTVVIPKWFHFWKDEWKGNIETRFVSKKTYNFKGVNCKFVLALKLQESDNWEYYDYYAILYLVPLPKHLKQEVLETIQYGDDAEHPLISSIIDYYNMPIIQQDLIKKVHHIEIDNLRFKDNFWKNDKTTLNYLDDSKIPEYDNFHYYCARTIDDYMKEVLWNG